MAPIIRPDVVFSDVIMGGMTGIEAAIAIMQIFPDCKVILSSGQHIGKELVRSAAENGDSFELMPKPFSLEFLINRLHYLYPGGFRL